MRSQIEPQMCSGIAKVVEYWEAILKRLHIYKTKACLREIHASLLRKHLHHLEHPSAAEQDVEAEEEINTKEENTMHDDEEDDKRYSPEPIAKQKKSRLDEEAGSFSPELMHVNEDEEAIDPEEDKAPVDKSKAPVYMIEKDGSSVETCLMRFHAGPPYEDSVVWSLRHCDLNL